MAIAAAKAFNKLEFHSFNQNPKYKEFRAALLQMLKHHSLDSFTRTAVAYNMLTSFAADWDQSSCLYLNHNRVNTAVVAKSNSIEDTAIALDSFGNFSCAN